MDSSKTIEEFKRINEALNQSLSYESYVFFVKVTSTQCRSKVLWAKLGGDVVDDQSLTMLKLRTQEWVSLACDLFAEMYTPTVTIQKLSKRLQEVHDLVDVPAYTFVFHAVAEHANCLKSSAPKLHQSSNCVSFSRLLDVSNASGQASSPVVGSSKGREGNLTSTTKVGKCRSISSLLMGSSLDNALKKKLEASRQELVQISKELEHYKGETARLKIRIEGLEKEKQSLEGILSDTVKLSDSLVAKCDELSKENTKLKLLIAEGTKESTDTREGSETELRSQDSKESLDSHPPTPQFSKERKTPSPTFQEGEGELYKAITDYVGDHPDLLSMRSGDLIWTTSELEGWLYGENINSGAVGLFPPEVVSRSSEI
jgi:hypothetical protein